MNTEMIDYQTRRVADGSQTAYAVPAADDRLAIQIREALRDRQAEASRSPQGRAVAADTHGQAVLQAGPL